MSKPRRFHLFNCDNIYELSIVENLLKAVKAKLGFEFSVEKQSFTLSEMSELSTNVIPKMHMDFAMFVVHAHESRLLINNDNLEYGYAKVYRALLQATGEKVIVVIGGDDNYKNEIEEEQSVISRWAWRKIAHSQVKEEFIDGRKNFVFSWNKKHRAIHEEALLHYFDPNKKGLKFEYQPLQQSLEPDPETAPPGRATEPFRNAPDENPEQSPSSRESRAGEMDYSAGARATGKTQTEEKLEMSEPGSATETEEKPVDGKYGQPLRSRLQKDQILTKESTKGNKNLDIGATISESQPSHPYAGTSNSGLRQAQAPVKTVMLNTRLRYGRISNRRDDILYWEPGWVIPDYIEKDLFRKHSKTSDAELVILSDEKDMLICQVNEKKSSSHQIQPEGFQHPHLAPGEMIKLKTRMYCGHISFDAKDVEIFAKSWRVPEELSSTLLKEYWTTPNANLLIVSDSKGNVRCIVQVGTFNKVFSFLNKTVGTSVFM
ncbi:uncharacterized protein LOC144663028 [Oculina patagonica]